MTTGLSSPPQDWFARHLDDLGRRAEVARSQGSDQDVEALVQDLETAVEELRVADEELRTQGEQIVRLLESRDLARWRYERITATLPVAVLTTDRHGRLRGVNPSAAALFGVRIDHLLRKPVFVFLDETDRHVLRQALTRARRGITPEPCEVTLRTRQGEVSVVAYAGPSEQRESEVTWLLLERDSTVTADSRQSGTKELAGELPTTLLALAALSARDVDARSIVQRAAEVCVRALGPGAELGICVGHPLSPESVVGTSAAVQLLDGWQIRAGEGPAVSAYDSNDVVTSDAVLDDDRWPRLRTHAEGDAHAHDNAVAGCLSLALRSADDVCGVLTVVLRPERSVTPGLVHMTQMLGSAVASLIQESEVRGAMQALVDDMRAALTSRAVIDQAKGVVMADRHCSADEAFQHLVTLSNTTHLKVRDVAQAIVEQVQHS
jgi:PAS domain S-box-containing protein